MYFSKKQQVQAKRRRRRLVMLFAVALIMLAAAAFVVFGIIIPGERRKPHKLALSGTAPYVFTGDGFAYVQNGALAYSGVSDKTEWSASLGSEEVELAASRTAAAVYNQRAVHFVDAKTGQKLFSRDYSGVLELVHCGTKYVGVLRRDDDGNRQLYINGLTGEDADDVTFSADQEVLDFGFYGPTDTLWTLTLNTAGVSPSCTLETYVIGQSTTGAMTVDGQLIEHVEFFDKKTYIVGTNHIIVFNELGKEDERTLIYGWRYVDFGLVSGKPSLIVMPRGQGDLYGSVKLITISGEERLLQLPSGVRGVFIAGGKYVVVTSGSVMYYSDKGEPAGEMALDITVEGAQKISDTQLLLTRGTEAYLLTIK